MITKDVGVGISNVRWSESRIPEIKVIGCLESK